MKPPLLAALVSALAFALAPALGSAAVDPAEWDSAVTALQEADPTIEPPLPDPASLTIVGGGKVALGTPQTLAVSARQDAFGVSGRMSVVVGSGTIFKASVVCIDAVTVPGGGGYAMVTGELDHPDASNKALVFRIMDSAQAGGAGDTWDQQTLPAVPPSCAAEPGTTPLVAGNVVIDPGG
jgi:hypothetical protein